MDLGTLNFQHFISISGVTRVLQIVFGIIVCSCAGVDVCHIHKNPQPICAPVTHFAPGQGFVLFVGATCIIFTSILLIAYLCRLQDRLYTLPWRAFEIIFTGAAIMLYFAAAVIECWYASGKGTGGFASPLNGNGTWIACAVFACFNWTIYVFQMIVFGLVGTGSE